MANLCLVLDSSLQSWERDYFHALGSRLEAEVHFPSERPAQSRLNPRTQMWFISRRWREWASYYARPGVFFTPLGPYLGNINILSHLKSKLGQREPAVHLVTHSAMSERFFTEVERRPQVTRLDLPYIPTAGNITAGRASPKGQLRIAVLSDFDNESNLSAVISVAHYVRRENALIQFFLRGNGPFVPHFLAQVRELGLQQTVMFENSSIPFQADTLLHLPLRSEHFIPLFQAGTAAVPVVSHEMPGIDRLMRDTQTGFFVPIHDTRATGQLILRLAEEVEMRQALGQKLQASCIAHQTDSTLENAMRSFFLQSTETSRAA